MKFQLLAGNSKYNSILEYFTNKFVKYVSATRNFTKFTKLKVTFEKKKIFFLNNKLSLLYQQNIYVS